jgi:hypothetical protein
VDGERERERRRWRGSVGEENRKETRERGRAEGKAGRVGQPWIVLAVSGWVGKGQWK